jgi:hypothetical protein
MNHADALQRELAKRKAARLAGKTRRPSMVKRKPPDMSIPPHKRYKPAEDGTRRGVPNGLPEVWLKSRQSQWARREADKYKELILRGYIK